MKLIQKIKLLHGATNKCYYYGCIQPFHSSKALGQQFNEKPEWLQKFKVKQVQMQKSDGLPVYLKKGFRDKVLYNITFVLVVIGVCKSIYILVELAYKK